MWLSATLSPSAGGLISQWDITMKSQWVHTVTSPYASWYDLRCFPDVKYQTTTQLTNLSSQLLHSESTVSPVTVLQSTMINSTSSYVPFLSSPWSLCNTTNKRPPPPKHYWTEQIVSTAKDHLQTAHIYATHHATFTRYLSWLFFK